MEIKSLDQWKKEHQTILDKIYFLTASSDESKCQKQKFGLLTNLIKELCTSQNSKIKFNNLTSLIVLLLNLYKKNYPLDIPSNNGIKVSNPIRQNNSELKRMLRSEFLINTEDSNLFF